MLSCLSTFKLHPPRIAVFGSQETVRWRIKNDCNNLHTRSIKSCGKLKFAYVVTVKSLSLKKSFLCNVHSTTLQCLVCFIISQYIKHVPITKLIIIVCVCVFVFRDVSHLCLWQSNDLDKIRLLFERARMDNIPSIVWFLDIYLCAKKISSAMTENLF